MFANQFFSQADWPLLGAVALFAHLLPGGGRRGRPLCSRAHSSKVRLDGTSTIHDWHADTDVIGG